MAVPSGPDEAGVVVVGAVAVAGAVELGVHVVGADVALGAAHREGRCRPWDVGTRHYWPFYTLGTPNLYGA